MNFQSHISAQPGISPQSRIQSANTNKPSMHRKLAEYIISNVQGITLSKAVNSLLRWVTLSAPARKIGKAIQGGYDLHAETRLGKARYLTGSVVKGLANVTGGISGFVSGIVSVIARGVEGLADIAIDLIKDSATRINSKAEKAPSQGSPLDNHGHPFHSSNTRHSHSNIKNTSSFHVQKNQQELTTEGALAVMDAVKLAGGINLGKKEIKLPEGYRHASYDDIPKSVLAKRKDGSGGDGSKLTLRISKGNDPRLILKSDPWSALKVVVYMRADGTPILVFSGTNPKSRPATIKSDLIAGALGIKDSVFQDADRLVAAFVKQFGKAEVIGHSLGGGIAQYAGIKNNSKVTTFNSMALHINLRNRLGQKINNADVTNINTSGDVLSQTIESKFWIFKMIAQVGKCYVIPDSGGHRMKDVVKGMKKLLGDKWQ